MAAPTTQNSSELHFRFINHFIQPSLVGSLKKTKRRDFLCNSQEKREAIEKLAAVGRVDSVLFTISFPNKKCPVISFNYSIGLDFIILPSNIH